jgi:hypothetical protein
MKPWFVVKRYGLGLSPSGWGWPFTFAYVAALAFGVVWASRTGGGGLAIAGLAVLTIAFFVVMALTSDHKPWRWRWGDDEP